MVVLLLSGGVACCCCCVVRISLSFYAFLFVIHLFTFSYLCFARKAAHIFFLLTPTHFYLRDLFLLVFRLFPLHFAFLKSFGSELWIYYAQALLILEKDI